MVRVVTKIPSALPRKINASSNRTIGKHPTQRTMSINEDWNSTFPEQFLKLTRKLWTNFQKQHLVARYWDANSTTRQITCISYLAINLHSMRFCSIINRTASSHGRKRSLAMFSEKSYGFFELKITGFRVWRNARTKRSHVTKRIILKARFGIS
jgi:hypothetical protein